MRTWLVDRWLYLRASYWFLPALMVAGAILTAFGMVTLDRHLGADWAAKQGWLYINQPDGARALLSTMAGSMITVAGVTFSMTLLAVSHASAQIGPRLMTRFMRDRGNQFTLGTFIATFLYGLVVLRTVHSGADGELDIDVFVPHLAILVGLVFAIASTMVLVYFIHHVPQTISVARIIVQVGDELIDGIRNLFPEQVGDRERSADGLPADFDRSARVIRRDDEARYMRVLDSDRLMGLACEHDLIVRLERRPGDYALPGTGVMRAWPADRVDDDLAQELLSVTSWGTQRTREQDVLFPLEQLLEILGKAMSPSVNGQYTALLCIDQIGRALAELLRRDIPATHRYDDDGNLRVVAAPISRDEFFAHIFRPMRQYTRGDWIATNKVLRMIAHLREHAGSAESQRLLDEEAARVRADVRFAAMPDTEKSLLLDRDS